MEKKMEDDMQTGSIVSLALWAQNLAFNLYVVGLSMMFKV